MPVYSTVNIANLPWARGYRWSMSTSRVPCIGPIEARETAERGPTVRAGKPRNYNSTDYLDTATNCNAQVYDACSRLIWQRTSGNFQKRGHTATLSLFHLTLT